MSLILIILSVIGAIPDIIAAVKMLWDLIKKIEDRPTRLAKTRKLRKLVLGHLSLDRKHVLNAGACLTDLADMETEVREVLAAQGA